MPKHDSEISRSSPSLPRALTRRAFLAGAASAAGVLALPALAQSAAQAEAPVPTPPPTEAELSARIEAALPAKSLAAPRRPRRLLIFDLNVGYPGHPSAKTANLAFTLMGRKTGAFETVVSSDPAVFKPESLRRFDAVFLNNTVGNLFTDPALRQSLIDFVYGGGGLMGVHGTSVAFTWWPMGGVEDWPEYALMLGMRGAFHRTNTEHAYLKLDDPAHPLNRPFGGQGFDTRDEFFRPQGTYSRRRVRVLFGFDPAKMDLAAEPHDNAWRADSDYAMAWVRNYGRGRIFYCSFAHNHYLFWDPKMLEFYLGATQFALGDLDAPTIPSARLTPAIRAQEKLGWRVGLESYTYKKIPLFDAIDIANKLGLAFIGGITMQQVSKEIPKNLEPGLTDDELRQLRLKLDQAAVRMLTWYIPVIPGDEAGCRAVFDFARKIGVETIISEPALESLAMVSRCCDDYQINVALHNHPRERSPHYWNAEGILAACEGKSKRLGAGVDLGFWLQSGLDPVQQVRLLKDRLITIQMHDLSEPLATGHDVALGAGAGGVERLLGEMKTLGVRPTMFSLEHITKAPDATPEVTQSVKFLNKLSLEMAR